MNIEIVTASIFDIDEINSIESSLNNRNLSKNSLISDINSNNYYYIIAKVSNNTVAYAGIELLIDHADITGIAVLKKYRNSNIATLLLNYLFDKCKELDIYKIFLEVRCSNIPAKTLYEKLGFIRISTRKNYYNNEDADIYEKLIP